MLTSVSLATNTRNPKPKPKNPKPETLNPKPEDPSIELTNMSWVSGFGYRVSGFGLKHSAHELELGNLTEVAKQTKPGEATGTHESLKHSAHEPLTPSSIPLTNLSWEPGT